MAADEHDIVFGSKDDYFKSRGPRVKGAEDSERWRASIRHLLTNSDLVAHYTLKEGERAGSIRNAISYAGKLEGVDNRLKIARKTSGNPKKTVISYWIEPATDLPEETPEQEAVDTSPASSRLSQPG